LTAVVEAASQQTPIGLVLTDAEFDGERNRNRIRQQLGAQERDPRHTWEENVARARSSGRNAEGVRRRLYRAALW